MAVASEHHEGSLQEEIELLEAIYIHELTLEGPKERPSSVSLLLHPSTGDEGEKQYVCLTLQIFLPNKYPNTLPAIHIKNPRGLSDAHVESIISNLRELAESRLGSPMLYELIEYAKESLTDNNIPSCACAICLSHFQDSHCFTKTECYHYFHCSCLARYIEYSLKKIKEIETTSNGSDEEDKEIVCPMCRLPIIYDLDALQAAPEDELLENEVSYSPDKKMKQLQKDMTKLYQKQLKKGGIINIEEEKNKYLIEIKAAPVPQITDEPVGGDDVTPDNDTDPGKSTSAGIDHAKNTSYPAKGYEERLRERPSSSRKNRGRGGQHYRNDKRWNERSEGARNDRSRGGSARGYYKGQRGGEANRIPKGADKYKESRREQTKKTFTKGPHDKADENKEIKELKIAEGIAKEQALEQDSVKVGKGTEQLQQPRANSDDTTIRSGSQNDDKNASSLKTTSTQESNIQDRKKTEREYREEEECRNNTKSDRKEVLQQRNEIRDHRHGNRCRNTNNVSVKPSSDETTRRASSDDKKRRKQKGLKKQEQNERGKTFSMSNDGGKSLPSRNDFEKTTPVRVDSQGEVTCNENKKGLLSNPKMDNKSSSSISRPPPGFEKIESNSRVPAGPPPGFESKDSLVRKPPPGF